MSDRWIPNPAPFPTRPPSAWPDWQPRPAPAPEGSPAEDPEQPESRVGMVLAVIGVALVAAIVTFLVLLIVRPPSRRVAVAPPTTVPSDSTTTDVPSTTVPNSPVITPARLRALTSDLVPFVESTRMLRFTSPPSPVLDDDAAFAKAWKVHLSHTDPIMQHLDIPFRALGLNPTGVDLVRAQTEFYGTKGIVFYDASTKVLHVRATPNSPYLSASIVEALTEQLDDQHFSTGRIDPTKGLGDEYLGLASLTIGDGQRVASKWVMTQSQQAQAEVQAEGLYRGDVMNPAAVPPALRVWLAFPASQGGAFTAQLVTSTTSAPLDAAFTTPPDGSAQVAVPPRYLDHIAQLPVTIPKADGPVATSGTFGALLLQQTLAPVVGNQDLEAVMQTYRGDSMVGWKSGIQACVRLRVTTGDDPIGLMSAALKRLADGLRGTVVSVTDPLQPGKTLAEFSVCSTGDEGESTTTTQPPNAPSSPPSTVPSEGVSPI